VTICRPSEAAVVLGSTQASSDVDERRAAAAGVPLARRQSGGGAVLVEPGALVWVDLTVARGDPLWRDDVSAAAHFVGEAWAAALRQLGVRGVSVHHGRLRPTPWSRALCFAGLGPGEVMASGRKAVGLSQRRRHGLAWFTTAAYLRPTRTRLPELLAGGPEARDRAALALGELSTDLAGEGARCSAEELEAALVANLPR
jgi:lipoate-protein ligase A